MAKEFKDFDRQFKEYTGTGLKMCGVKAQTLELRQQWPFSINFTEDYSAGTIRTAVYESDTALDWQKFRVGLKGLNTSEKLACLREWWTNQVIHVTGSEDERQRNIIRVNNYLGALKRGGQLDQDLRVVK